MNAAQLAAFSRGAARRVFLRRKSNVEVHLTVEELSAIIQASIQAHEELDRDIDRRKQDTRYQDEARKYGIAAASKVSQS